MSMRKKIGCGFAACLALLWACVTGPAHAAEEGKTVMDTAIAVPALGNTDVFITNVMEAINKAPVETRQALHNTVLFIAYSKLRYEAEVKGIQHDFSSITNETLLAVGFLAIHKAALAQPTFSLADIIGMGNDVRADFPEWDKDFKAMQRQ